MSDKRQWPRYSCGWHAKAHGATGSITNVSMSGAQLAIPELAAAMLVNVLRDGRLSLSIRSPAGEITGTARIVYDAPWDDERLLGLQFIDLDEVSRSALEAGVAKLAEKRNPL